MIRLQKTTKHIDWQRVSELLAYFDLSEDDAKTQQRIFQNSYAVVFLFDETQLIGVGRALSDGLRQAAIYNIALDVRYHGQGLGRQLIDGLLEQVNTCHVILYTHPKTVRLYQHLGFRLMKTGLARYQNENAFEAMGFID